MERDDCVPDPEEDSREDPEEDLKLFSVSTISIS